MSDEQNQPVDNSHKSASIAAKAAAEPPAGEKAEQKDTAAIPATDESVDEGENTEGSAPSDGKDAPARTGKKPGVHQRIDELTREKHEARREADELRKRLEQMEKGAKPSTPDAPAAKQPDAEPTLEQFDFDVKAFTAARDKWVRENAVKEVETKRQEEARESERKAHKEAFDKRLSAFEKDNPGAWEAATKAPMTLTPPMLEVIATSDHGPQIGVYLAQNLEEADRISKLSPIAAAAALGRIEASLSTRTSSPEPKPVTKAPAPVQTLSGSPSVRKSYDDMSMKEYDEARRKERAARGLAP